MCDRRKQDENRANYPPQYSRNRTFFQHYSNKRQAAKRKRLLRAPSKTLALIPTRDTCNKLMQFVVALYKSRKKTIGMANCKLFNLIEAYCKKTPNDALRDCAFCGRIAVRRKVTKTWAIGAAGAQVPYKDKAGGSNPSSPTMNFSRSSCIFAWWPVLVTRTRSDITTP